MTINKPEFVTTVSHLRQRIIVRKNIFIFVVGSLLMIDAAYGYECKPEYWHACVDGSCDSGTGDMTIYFSENEKTVSRCDKNGCTPVKVDVARSGVMTKAASASSGYLLVINTMDSTFTEIATSVTAAFVKSGKCAQ